MDNLTLGNKAPVRPELLLADATLALLSLDPETPEETPFADIARHIDDAGFESIILAPPSSSAIAKSCALSAIPIISHSTVCLVSTPDEKEILYCKGLLKAAKKPRIAIDSRHGDTNSKEKLYPVKRAINSALAEHLETYVILSANSKTEELISQIKEYSSFGTTGFILVFSDGAFIPQDATRIIQSVKKEAENSGAALSVSFNDKFGIAEAHAVHALHSGVDSIICAAIRGNTVYTVSLLGILENNGIRGFSSKMNIREINKLSAFAAFTSGRSARKRLPITDGESVKITGRPALARRAVDLGYTLEDETLGRVYASVRTAISKGIPVTDSVLSSAISDSQYNGRFGLNSYQVQSGSSAIAVAAIEVRDSQKKEVTSITASSKAGTDGAVFAALGNFCEFKDIKIIAYTSFGISKGGEVMSEATVRLSFLDKESVGRAMSFDAAEALIKAYIAAANRFFEKNAEK